MLNKKGFTIAEVLVSFSLISIILASMISATIFYRDKLKQEEVISQLNDYKNGITKKVYDDIIENNITRVEKCIQTQNCINFIDSSNKPHVMKIVEYENSTPTISKGVYLYYNGIQYLLPDSDLGAGNDRICDFVGGIDFDSYDNKIYKVKLSYRHKDIGLHYDLLFVVN